MKKQSIFALLLAAAICLLPLSGCGGESEPSATPDPHEGMVYINIGDYYDWIYPAEGLELSNFTEEDFTLRDDGIVEYNGEEYETRLGIDVSFYQGEIDWQAVADAGVEFAMIRCGYRGYGAEGNMAEDTMFRQNMEGALAAGLDVGVYFFSQSLGAIEAAEEALYVLDLIEGYDITMPVAFDWEPVAEAERYEEVDSDAMTSSALVFCEMIKDAGYTPCVYFYRYIAYHDYDLSRLADFPFWIGAPGSAPDFYYEAAIWQFSFTSRIDGIDADVDMNLQFYAPGADPSFPGPEPSPVETEEPAESPEPAEETDG